MAKYKGKHNGQTRGPYVKAAFRNAPRSYKRTRELAEQLHLYLRDQGYCIERDTNRRDEYYDKHYSAYHVAAATIGMTAMYYHKKPDTELPQRFVELIFISNDSLDDVVQKITEKFPGFKELNWH